jgi:hypothetical protein
MPRSVRSPGAKRSIARCDQGGLGHGADFRVQEVDLE